MQIDVFTQIPHAFGWLTEQRPLAAVLGTELELRLFGYRDSSPLKSGQIDDEPYGGGAGMLLRIDVVAAALDAVYGGPPARRVVALSPQGRQLDQELVEELASEERLTLLSARFEGFDERVLDHLCTDVISIGPYVLAGGDRSRGELLGRARGRARVSALHPPGRLPRLERSRGPALRRSRPDCRLEARAVEIADTRPVRNPVDYLTGWLPRPWRIAVDWIATIVGAIAIVLVVKAYVVNPYRIPSSSMEPTLHCAQPGSGCETGRFSDRVLANRLIYHFRSPQRGDIVVFNTPPLAAQRCGAGGTFVKRLIVLPGETWEMRNGVVYIGGKRLIEPYIKPDRRGSDTRAPQKVSAGRYIMLGDNRTQSCDSRVWGSVKRDALVGKVFAVYWPPNRISFR